MNINEYLAFDENEKPLDNIVTDGGMCGIFRKICCIGDSLSSGEFESCDTEGNKSYHDMFDYSWGQYLARDAGCTVYNFSRGGMTAKEYIESFAEANGFWAEDKLCQAYIIALGVNDIFGLKQDIGSVSDIAPDGDITNAGNSFAAYYGAIIHRIKKLQPKARFFLVSMPRTADEPQAQKEEHSRLLHDMAKHFDFTYVIDLYSHAPVYDAEFIKKYYLHGHLNPMGYRLTAKIMESYIDHIIRHNMNDFIQIPFIGSRFYDERFDS